MEPRFQGSFIPPKGAPVPGRPFSPAGRGPGIFLVITLVVFLVTVLAGVGLFLWQRQLKSDIVSMEARLAEARAAFDENQLRRWKRFNDRIEVARGLIKLHLSVSRFFKLLEDNTLSNVSFSSLEFTATEGGNVTLSLKGLASGFSAVALQSARFAGNPFIKNPIFSGFNLDETGDVEFEVKAGLDPALILYASRDEKVQEKEKEKEKEKKVDGAATSTPPVEDDEIEGPPDISDEDFNF